MRGRVFRIKLNGPLEFFDGFGGLPLVSEKLKAERCVGFGKCVVNLKRTLCSRSC